MDSSVEVTSIPDCDLCREHGRIRPAFAHAKLPFGAWAYVCVEHFIYYRCRLGTGRGKRLILKPPKRQRNLQ